MGGFRSIRRSIPGRATFLVLALVACSSIISSDSAHADRTNGAWLSPEEDNWPLVPVHAALTPDGRVLTFGSDSGGTATGFFIYDIWDPAAGLSGGHVTLPNLTETDIFCATVVTLPESGDLFIAGGAEWTGTEVSDVGNNKSTIFDRGDDSLSLDADMNRPRWYASATTLMNGEIYIQGGKSGEDLPEVREVDGGYRLLTGAPTSQYLFFYPRNFLAPNGRVFGFDLNGLMYWVTTDGTGTITPAGQLETPLIGRPSTAVMYRPGRILHVAARNNSAVTIDINGDTPVVEPTGLLSSRRSWANATVLPNGNVLVTGGSGQPNQLVDVNNSAEIWDPHTGQWTVGASGRRPRLYHSFALLLPDASVLVGGGGAADDAPLNNLHAEIYYPPYLYNDSGGFANRPVIATAPSVLHPGQDFSVTLDAAGADRVTLVNTGAVTHGVNLQQRFVELGFTANGNVLSIDMPARATDTPPGYYLLFVLNGNGVPSRGRIVRIDMPGEPPPDDDTAPSRPTELALTKVQGNPRLTWTASTDNVGVAGYAVHRSTDGTLGPEIVRVEATTWTDLTVQEGTKYTYAVKAFDAAGNLSSASTRKSITAFQIPTKPTDFALRLVSKDPQLNFSPSTDNVGVVGYNVYRSTNGTLGPLFAQIDGPGWIDTSAQAGIRYTYAVRARDAAGYLSNRTALKGINAK
jgi:Domain of unknown function (DUF1929)